jgi:hypothetical protein
VQYCIKTSYHFCLKEFQLFLDTIILNEYKEEGESMNENEIKEFLEMVMPMLKDLPQEEIIENINNIPDMSQEEREKFIQAILALKEEN